MTVRTFNTVSTLLAAACAAMAQAPAPPAAPAPAQSQAPMAEPKSWNAGFRFSGHFLNFFDKYSLKTFDSVKWRSTSSETSDISNPLSFGVTFGYHISSRVSLNADLLYRRAGYRTGLEIQEGADDPATAADERKITSGFEQTKADYWDIPLTMRIHDSRFGRRVRGFVELGGTLRHAASIRSYRELSQPGGAGTVSDAVAPPNNKNVLGATVGAGWDWQSAKGVGVVPQIRYTRWLNSVYDLGTPRSNRNQIEFLLGIVF